MKNSLQKNNGDGSFSEIGQLAGVSNTDWSWSPLLCDFDNDGRKDLFVSNGYKRDNTDIQFIKYSIDQSMKMQQGAPAVSAAEYISHMPSIKTGNYIYQNIGEDKFINKIIDWGLEKKTLSHGAAYADLDNDGDMDIVTNNTDDYAGIYQNNADKIAKNNFLKIQLQGVKGNIGGTGAKIYAMAKGKIFYHEQTPVRGYCSSVDAVLNIGLGKISSMDSIRIIWGNNKTQLLTNIDANQTLTLLQSEATELWTYNQNKPPVLFSIDSSAISFRHIENEFNDFTVQSLLPGYLSRQGPCMAMADVNKDGKEDLFIGGAKGQSAQLFLQTSKGTFVAKVQPSFATDAVSEDVAAAFFDADNDGDTDLYVGSGGYEFLENENALQDRLYLNDGQGNFSKKANAVPVMLVSTACVTANDIDADGDTDLFVGGRCVPGKYPSNPESKILLNDGKANFVDTTKNIASSLQQIGMVTDALWIDVNKDASKDLLIVGEWMEPKLFLYQQGKLVDASSTYFKAYLKGWWNKIHAADFDKDGDLDIVLGNQGWNNQFTASEKKPMSLYFKDFDGNGSIDPFLYYFIGDTSYPAFSRDDVVQQVPILNKKFLNYTEYADVTYSSMFTKEQLEAVQELHATNLETIYLENTGDGFASKQLPVEAQYAPVHSILSLDANKDGRLDLLLAGNNTHTRIKFSRYDANHGMLLLGDGKGNFNYLPQWQSGLNVQGNVRAMLQFDNRIIFGMNNSSALSYRLN